MRAHNWIVETSPTAPSWAAVITNGDMARANFDLIAAAKKEIYIVEFLFRDDEFGRAKLALLRRKSREGVRVHLHVDAFHFLVNPALIYHLLSEGLDVTVFNELRFARLHKVTSRNHCKLLIVDDHVLKIGDANTGNEYVLWGPGHHMKSVDVIIDGPVAIEARRFAQSLIACADTNVPQIEIASVAKVRSQRRHIRSMKSAAKKFFGALRIQMDAPDQFTRPHRVLISETEVAETIHSLDLADADLARTVAPGTLSSYRKRTLRPEQVAFFGDSLEKDHGPHALASHIAKLFQRAQSDIVIVTPYLLLTPGMKAALHEALRRGVRVRIFTNSIESTDNRTTQIAYEYDLENLAAEGFEIFEYGGKETLHAKFISVDQKWSMVMTYNFDWRSELLNLETAVELTSESVTADLHAWLDQHESNFHLVAEGGSVKKSDLTKILPPTWPGRLFQRLVIHFLQKQL